MIGDGGPDGGLRRTRWRRPCRRAVQVFSVLPLLTNSRGPSGPAGRNTRMQIVLVPWAGCFSKNFHAGLAGRVG